MVRIFIFGKNECAKCKTIKNKISHLVSGAELEKAVQVVFHDMETLDGRAEGAFYNANQIPLTVIEKEGQEVARWDGSVPDSQAVRLILQEGANAAAH